MLYTLTNVLSWSVLFAGTALGILLLSLCCLLMAFCAGLVFNKASWYILDMYGGIKTFNEYKKWFKENQLKEVKK